MADIVLQLSIPEEHLILLNKLQLNDMLFSRLMSGHLAERAVSPEALLRVDVRGEELHLLAGETPVARSRCRHLGNYGPLDPTAPEGEGSSLERPVETVWTWNESLRKTLPPVDLPADITSSPIVVASDPMLVSYILAHLTDALSLEHVLTVPSRQEGVSVAYGLSEITFIPRDPPAPPATEEGKKSAGPAPEILATPDGPVSSASLESTRPSAPLPCGS